MIATIETLNTWINETSNKKRNCKNNITAEKDILNSARQVVIQKSIWEVLNEVLEIVYSHNDNLTKATPQVKELLMGIKDNYEKNLSLAYDIPEDRRLEAIAKVRTVNKLLRML